MTTQSHIRVTDYRLTDAGVEIDWQTPGQSHAHLFSSADLAGALWDLKHCDNTGPLNGEIVCIMDGRPGFHSTALPSEVWAALHGIDRYSVCLQMIFELQKSNAK